MANYAKNERQAMSAAFRRVFNVSTEISEDSKIVEWMENAPIVIVEYDGSFKGEKARDRDRRMEIIEVYDGNISTLCSYLRQVFKEYRSLSKWEMIFKLCSGITDTKKLIDQAETRLVFSETESTVTETQTTEELPTNQSTSTEVESKESTTIEVTEKAEGITEVKVEKTEEVKTTVKSVAAEPNIETIVDNSSSTNSSSTAPSSKMDTTELSVSKSSGNGEKVDQSSLFNTNNKPYMEEKKMSETNVMDAIMNSANAISGDAAEVQKAPTSNVSKPETDNKEAQARVAELLGAEKEARNAWTRNNTVTAIISTQKPAALRVIGQEGVVSDETDETKKNEAIKAKAVKFICAVSGKNELTIDQFEAMSDADKYANVANPEHIDKARAIYELYKKMIQNPDGKFAAYIPGADKVSYPTKGYMIGSTPYPTDEFIVQLIDNGMGIIYGEGSCDAQGNDIGDKPVTFQVGIAKRQEKAQSTGVAVGSKATKVPVIRPKNKKEFISGGNHVVYLFTKEDTEAQGKASFKAAITVGGEMMPATVSVFALDNGKKVVRSQKEDGTVTYKTKVASCAVSVPVTKIVKEFGVEYRGDEDITITAGKWGINMTTKTQKGNYGQITEFSASPVFDVFANVYSGDVNLSSLKGSSAVAMLKAAADQQAAEEAQASASELV